MLSDLTVDEIIQKDIIELMGGEKLPVEQKKSLHQKMLETVQNRVIFAIDESLNDKQREEFKAAGESTDLKAIDNFFVKHNIPVAQMMVDEATRYKIELLAYTEVIKKSDRALADIKQNTK